MESTRRRIAPALVLVMLAPFVAEFLLGNTTLSVVSAYLIDLAVYGCGAVLIREVTRRTGRGWPTILALGLAYGVVEEGLGDMSLFNPGFGGAHLLRPGNLLGIGWPWWFFVLTLHVVWSIGASVGLAEALYARRGTAPWLGRLGLAVTTVVFVVGVAVIHVVFAHGFGAFPGYRLDAVQVGLSVGLVAAAVAVAFAFRPVRPAVLTGRVPAPWLVGLVALVGGSAFVLLNQGLLGGWSVLTDFVTYLAIVVPTVVWSRCTGWTAAHRFAPAAGALLTYCWVGFAMQPKSGVDLAGQVAFAALALVLTALAARRVRTASAEPLAAAT